PQVRSPLLAFVEIRPGTECHSGAVGGRFRRKGSSISAFREPWHVDLDQLLPLCWIHFQRSTRTRPGLCRAHGFGIFCDGHLRSYGVDCMEGCSATSLCEERERHADLCRRISCNLERRFRSNNRGCSEWSST